MTRRRRGIAIWAGCIALALAGCSHESGPAPTPAQAPAGPQATAPSSVAGQTGEGPVAVYGASVYSPGQEIYKQLRQEDSLMAFLACQGEPDRLEVLENPGAAPRIILEYSRPGIPRRGTVEIAPSPAGYYAAKPIDPSGSLKSAARKPAKPASKPKPATKPQAAPTPAPSDEPETQVDEPEPTPPIPQPSAAEREECPIEPWRDDCRALCTPAATWEWCSYRK